MANRAQDKLYDPSVQKLAQQILGIIARILTPIGFPFFLLFTYLFIIILFAFQFAAKIADFSFSLLPKIPSKIKTVHKFKAKKEYKFTVFAESIVLKFTPRVVFLTFLFSILIFWIWLSIFKDLPNPKALSERKIETSTKIYDRNGILLYKIYKNKNRTLTSLDKIPRHVILATLAAEDAEFYDHPGFSIKGIIRAAVKNWRGGKLSGGSTITQQLVKNALLTPERTIARKIKEIILAVEIEFTFPKDKILEMYLNEVGYGGTAYGIEEASQTYFGKEVDKLSLAEAAVLAGLPKSPSKYSPFSTSITTVKERQKEVLRLMKINRFITEDEAESASNEQIYFVANKTEIKAPHFVMFIRDLLEKIYGQDTVEKEGLEVYTTLDWQIQKTAEDIIKKEIERLSPLKVGNASALVINPQTGELLAMVGSKDYFDLKAGGNVNVALSERSPGSSIKVVNYAYALERGGFTPGSILSDTPVTFKTPGTEPYSPKNYDGSFRGNITLRKAFAESRNIPAVKVLATYGVTKMIEIGKALGITTWDDPSKYGLSLTLGGGGVKLIELSQAYATVANYGKKVNLNPILKITNYKGKVLEENGCVNGRAGNPDSCKSQKVISPETAFLITDILKDNEARAGSFGTNSQLVVRSHPEVAVKTGTSNDLRDNLTIGYNQNYLVAVWVGNNDNSPMSRIASGITGAAPIFNKIISAILSDKEPFPWQIPDNLVQLPICTYTGTLSCSGCPTRMEWFKKENAPKKYCSPEVVQKIIEEKASNQKAQQNEGQILESGASISN